MMLFRVKVYNYEINVYSDWKISDIFDNVVIKNWKPDCTIKNEYCNDNQTQRLLINREIMLKYKDNWVMHSVSCRLKTGYNLVICWKVWSWKSYFYELLVKSWLVEKLYDEDLIGINEDWVLFSLAKANFKGKVNWEYNYEQDEPDFWKIDLFVIMWCDAEKNHKTFRGSFIDSIVHNLYKNDKGILEHYDKFPLFKDIKYYTIPYTRNQDRENSIYSVIKDIWTREKKSY